MLDAGSKHTWMVETLSYLVDYTDNEGLPEVSAALVDALEVIAPLLNPRQALEPQPIPREPSARSFGDQNPPRPGGQVLPFPGPGRRR